MHSEITRLDAARPCAVEDDTAPLGGSVHLPQSEAALLGPIVRHYEHLLRRELTDTLRPDSVAVGVMKAIGDQIGDMLACEPMDLACSQGGAMPVEELTVLVGRFAWRSARHVVHVYLPTLTKDPGAVVSVRPNCAPVFVYVTCCQCPGPETQM